MSDTSSESESASTAPARWSWVLLLIAFFVCLVPVFCVGGFQDGFTYWNSFPVALALITLLASRQGIPARTFAVVCAGFSVLIHLAWLGDWGRTATGSSTSGLVFIFLPIWSIIVGGVASFIAWLAFRFGPRSESTLDRTNTNDSNT